MIEGAPKKKLSGPRSILAAVALGSLPTADTAPVPETAAPAASQQESAEPSLRQSLYDANPFLFSHTEASEASRDPSLEAMEEIARLLPQQPSENRMQYANRLAGISRYLYSHELSSTESSIAAAIERIEQAKERFGDYPVFGRRTLVGAGVDTVTEASETRAQFLDEQMASALEAEAPGYEVFSGLNENHQATAESATEARNAILEAIASSGSESITVLFNAHGGEDRIYLGEVGLDSHANTDAPSNISPQDLAEAFIRKYQQGAGENPDVLILANCYSGSFVLDFLTLLRDQGAPIPIILTATESGQAGLTLFHRNLSELAARSGGLRVRDLIEHFSRTDLNIGSNPVIFLPDLPDNARPVQVARQEDSTRGLA